MNADQLAALLDPLDSADDPAAIARRRTITPAGRYLLVVVLAVDR